MNKLKISNIHEGFGSIVEGLDPHSELDAETCRVLKQLFDDRSALLFPGTEMDAAFQGKLCRMLVDDQSDGVVTDKTYNVSNKEPEAAAPYGRLMFHADMMWHAHPFRLLSLYGAEVDPASATTSLASGVYAWTLLPEKLRQRIEKREAVHITGQVFHRGGDDLLRPEREQEVSIVKSIVQYHPVTNKPILYVSQQNTREIVGLGAAESEELLQELFSYFYSPENVYEHHWSRGDLLVFDNIASQHGRGNVERDAPTRTLRKVIAPVPKASAEKPRFTKAM